MKNNIPVGEETKAIVIDWTDHDDVSWDCVYVDLEKRVAVTIADSVNNPDLFWDINNLAIEIAQKYGVSLYEKYHIDGGEVVATRVVEQKLSN